MKYLNPGDIALRLGIMGKLLGIVLPLVVLPCLATGGLSYFASERIVTRLLNQSQINLAREIAEQIDLNFKTCRADLQLISHLPVLQDYYYNRFYDLETEAEVNRKQVEGFLKDLSRKSNLYHRISYLDSKGIEVASVCEGDIVLPSSTSTLPPLIARKELILPKKTVVLPVRISGSDRHFVVSLIQPLFDRWDELAGLVLIDMDINELGKRILSRRIGVNGYAFVLDNDGRTLIHPETRHISKMPEDLEEPSVEVMIRSMLHQRQGMIPYYYQGDKIAAFTDIRDQRWIVAVTLPISEFKTHLTVIKKQVFHIIIVSVSLALVGGAFFSWHFLRPIKKLAKATDVISEGRLPSEIPIATRDELGVLTNSFNHMVRNLRQIQIELVKNEKLVSMGRLAAGVAHEIRNPLNAMNVTLGSLKRRIDNNPKATELTEMISEEISRVDHFLSEFLSYSKQPPPKPTLTNVNEMIEDILSEYKIQAAEKKIEVRTQLDPMLLPFPLDPFQIERAIRNVVVNALEAMPQGGNLNVKTKWRLLDSKQRKRENMELSISDTGKGMNPEMLKNVFDPFFTTKELGSGFGLPFTQSIIEMHGGQVRLSSEPGEGTTVTLILPLNVTQSKPGTESE